MKNLILITIFALISFQSQAQLNKEAKYIQKNLPEYYEPIKKAAVKEWVQDHRMIVYTINQQAEAFVKVTQYLAKYKKGTKENDILRIAYSQWATSDKTDWRMVVYEFEKQMESYNSY